MSEEGEVAARHREGGGAEGSREAMQRRGQGWPPSLRHLWDGPVELSQGLGIWTECQLLGDNRESSWGFPEMCVGCAFRKGWRPRGCRRAGGGEEEQSTAGASEVGSALKAGSKTVAF